MSIKSSVSGKKEFEPVPQGTHVARVYSIIHIGIVQDEWQGQPLERDKVRIGFELPNEVRVFKEGSEPLPMVLSEEYSVSMNEKANLRKLVEGILGALSDAEAEDFDVLELMGKVCLINVSHRVAGNGKTYANVKSAAPLLKGMEAPPAVNPPFVLDFNENWNAEKFEKLPEFLKEKIKSSRNYKEKFPENEDQPPF